MTEPIKHNIDEDIKDMLGAIYITNRRIYDVLARMLHSLDSDEANALIDLHDQGVFITPPPRYMIGDDDAD